MSDSRPDGRQRTQAAAARGAARGGVWRYGIAIVVVVAATLLTFVVQMALGAETGRIPFALYFPAVIIATLYGGRGPGLLTALLSALASAYFFVPPSFNLAIGLSGAIQVGVFLFVSLLIHSLTERRQRAESHARKSEEWLATTLNSIGDAVIATDARGCVTFMNPVAQTLTGWTEEEARGRALPEVFRIINEDTRGQVESPVEKVLREGSVVGLANHTLLVRRDGTEVPIDDSGAPIKDAQGGIGGVVLVFHEITERRRAEETIRRRERELTDFVENATVGLHWVGADGTILWANKAELDMLGYSADEYIGHNVAEFHVDAQVIADILERLSCKESLNDYEARLRHKDGGIRHVIINSNVMWSDKGDEFIHTRCFTRDITERKRAEEALRVSEQSYRHLADSMPQIVWTARADGYFDYYNKRWFEYTGLTLEQTQGWGWQPAVHPDDLERCIKTWSVAIETGENYTIECRFRRASDGMYRWHLGRAEPMRDAQGKIVRWFGTATDIHDRKQTEETLRFLAEASALLASSLNYETILQRLASLSVLTLADYCLIDVIEDDGRVRRIATAHHDAAKEELVRALRKYPPDLDKGEGVARALRTGEPEIVREITEEKLRAMTRDETHAQMIIQLGLKSFMTVPLLTRERTVGALTLASASTNRHYSLADLSFAEELARRAALAIENARLYKRAQEANKAKDEFLATLSHELRTPLTPIIGWIHMMRTGRLKEPDVAQGLNVIEKNSQSLTRLINDLLDMSSIMNGKMRIERVPVELGSVIREAIETIRPQADKEAIRIEVLSCEDGADLTVSGDRTRLVQVFWNLLHNAVKFSRAGGSVRVTCARIKGGEVRIDVSDEGEGVPAEFQPYVFERFRQADGSTTRAHGGLGIGLALVKSFVEAHGGRASVESEGAGRGSRFSLTLPLLSAPVEEGLSEVAPEPPPLCPGGVCRVLIIDDARDTLDMLKVVFESRGFETMGCETADEALRVASSLWFDIVVSDIGLPMTDGYELIKRLREIPHLRDVPAVALTGYAAQRDAETALAAGFDMHIPKPVDPTALSSAVEKLLHEKVRQEEPES